MTPVLAKSTSCTPLGDLTALPPVADDRPQVCLRYIERFAPRDDVYARWDSCRGHWVAVRAEMTPDVIYRALTGTAPVSAYFPGTDNSTQVLAMDIDLDVPLDGLPAQIARAATAHGLPAYIEGSRRGAHIWIVLDEQIPASAARRSLHAILQIAGAPDDPRIELRPVTDHLYNPQSVGHALRMPMMRHQTTQQRSWLLDPVTLTPIATTVTGTLEALKFGSAGAALELARQLPAPTSNAPRRLPPIWRDGPISRFNAEVTVSDVLRDDFGVLNARPGRTVRCPCHEDRQPSLSIARDDRRAWCHSPTCVLHGPEGAGHDAYGLWRLAQPRTPSWPW